MIVKVQLSITSSGPQQCLIYNKDRSTLWQGNADKTIQRKMGTKQRMFFEAEVRDSILHLVHKVEDQDW